MELTNELRARIFGLYLGCDVRNCYNEKIGKLVGVDMYNEVVKVQDRIGYSFEYGKVKLLLTPLENITDADAIACYDLTADEQDIKNIIPSKKIDIIKVEINGGILIDYRLVDYLRSKGYHIPYMGLNLFQSGIAIERTPTVQPQDKEQMFANVRDLPEFSNRDEQGNWKPFPDTGGYAPFFNPLTGDQIGVVRNTNQTNDPQSPIQ